MKEEDIISYQEIPPESEQSTEMKLELSEVKYYYACVIIIFTLCMQKMRSIHKLEALSPKRHENNFFYSYASCKMFIIQPCCRQAINAIDIYILVNVSSNL